MTGFPASLHFCDDFLLQHRHLFGRQFNTEIAASNHDGIGFGNDFVDVGNRLRLFNLCHDGKKAARLDSLDDVRTQRANILCRANEGERHIVDVVLDAEFQIANIFCSKRRSAHGNVWQIDSLFRRERTAGDHFASNVGTFHFYDSHAQLSIIEQNHVVGMNVACEV